MKNSAIISIVLAGILAGTGGIFIKYISVSPASIAWMRTAVPSLLLLGWFLFRGTPLFHTHPIKMWGVSALNALRMYLFIVAFVYTSIGNAAILFYSYPIFTTILDIKILGEKVSTKQFLLLGLTFLGMLIAYSDQDISFQDNDFIGMAAAVVSAIVYSFTVIIYKSESEHYSRNELIFYQNLLGTIVFFPFLISDLDIISIQDMTLGFSYAIVIGLGVFGLFFYSLRSLKASTATAIMYLEVASAILLSYIVFGDALSSHMIIGGSLIITSSFLITRLP